MAYNFQTWFPLTIHTIQFVSQLHIYSNFTSFNQHPPSQPLLWLLHHFSVLPGTRSNVSTSHPRRRKSRAAPAAPAIFSYQHDVCLASAGTETHLPPASGGSREVESQEAAGIVESCCSRWWWVLDLASFLCWSSPTSVWGWHKLCFDHKCFVIFFGEKNLLHLFHQRRSCTRASLCDFQSWLQPGRPSSYGLVNKEPSKAKVQSMSKDKWSASMHMAQKSKKTIRKCSILLSDSRISIQNQFLNTRKPTGFQVIFEPLPNDIKVTSRGRPIYWTFEFASSRICLTSPAAFQLS